MFYLKVKSFIFFLFSSGLKMVTVMITKSSQAELVPINKFACTVKTVWAYQTLSIVLACCTDVD